MLVAIVCILITTNPISSVCIKDVLENLCGPSALTPNADVGITRQSLEPACLPEKQCPVPTPTTVTVRLFLVRTLHFVFKPPVPVS